MTSSAPLPSPELADLRGRMRRFIDDEVIAAEPEFFRQQEQTGFAGAAVLEPQIRLLDALIAEDEAARLAGLEEQ